MRTYARYIVIIGVIALAVVAGFYIGKSQRLTEELAIKHADIVVETEVPVVESADEKMNVQPQKSLTVLPEKKTTVNPNDAVLTPPALP